MAYRLLVFDWDGTVMDSADRIVSSIQATISELGLAARSRGQVSQIIGLNLGEAIETLYPGEDDAFHERLVTGYRRQFRGTAARPSAPFPGVGETLAALSRAGYLLAVATGKGRRGLDQELAATGYREYFQATRCADDAPSKPHPGMLEQLMDEIGAEPTTTLMVGDTVFDIEMANHAGTDAVAVTCGAHSRERLAAAQPLALLDGLAELLPWLADREGKYR